MEDKLDYEVFACTKYGKHALTKPDRKYTRTRADHLLNAAKKDRDYLRGELYLGGVLLRWWEKGSGDDFVWPVKTQGENLPRRK